MRFERLGEVLAFTATVAGVWVVAEWAQPVVDAFFFALLPSGPLGATAVLWASMAAASINFLGVWLLARVLFPQWSTHSISVVSSRTSRLLTLLYLPLVVNFYVLKLTFGDWASVFEEGLWSLIVHIYLLSLVGFWSVAVWSVAFDGVIDFKHLHRRTLVGMSGLAVALFLTDAETRDKTLLGLGLRNYPKTLAGDGWFADTLAYLAPLPGLLQQRWCLEVWRDMRQKLERFWTILLSCVVMLLASHLYLLDGLDGWWLSLRGDDTKFATTYSDRGFREVCPGMSKRQVRLKLGESLRVWMYHGLEVWSYSEPESDGRYRIRVVQFREGLVVRKVSDFVPF